MYFPLFIFLSTGIHEKHVYDQHFALLPLVSAPACPLLCSIIPKKGPYAVPSPASAENQVLQITQLQGTGPSCAFLVICAKSIKRLRTAGPGSQIRFEKSQILPLNFHSSC